VKNGRLRRASAAGLPQDVLALLDALPIPAMLIGANGDVLHSNAAMQASDEPGAGEGVPVSLPGAGDCTLVIKPAAGPQNAQTQRLASLGFMLAGVCHEVSNPLSAIYSMVQILQSKRGVTPETLEKGLASIASNIARVVAMTRKLDNFSRVIGDAPEPVAIDETVEAAAALLRHSDCGLAVDVRYRGAPGALVRARAGELQQVVFNILLNAAQAMQGAGRIEAEARLGGDRTIILTVRDTGPGIPTEHLMRVFDPFFTTKQPGEGTGLGLAISYEIAQELGGTIRACNHPGGGACFDVVLPQWRG
jgi:C4-dicarboxylate-specific signal transduction histidine kinase